MLKLLETKKITQDAFEHLIPTANVTPRIYGTPKIHKKDTPLCPMVDSIGSVTYSLSKALIEIIKPLLGTTEHHCKNSNQLTPELNNINVETDEILISHDVVSQFRITPLDVTLHIVQEHLRNDRTLKNAQTSQLKPYPHYYISSPNPPTSNSKAEYTDKKKLLQWEIYYQQ